MIADDFEHAQQRIPAIYGASARQMADFIRRAQAEMASTHERTLRNLSAVLGRDLTADENGNLQLTDAEIETLSRRYPDNRMPSVFVDDSLEQLRAIPIVRIPNPPDSRTPAD